MPCACRRPLILCAGGKGTIAFAFGNTVLPEVQATVGGDVKKTMCAPRRPPAGLPPDARRGAGRRCVQHLSTTGRAATRAHFHSPLPVTARRTWRELCCSSRTSCCTWRT